MKNTVQSHQINVGILQFLFKVSKVRKPTVRQRKLNIRRV